MSPIVKRIKYEYFFITGSPTIFIYPQYGLNQILQFLLNISYMPEGTYQFHKKFTQEMMEMDEDHGILQNQQRSIVFSAPNAFKFSYHFYYEYENGYYVMVDQVINDTSFSGSYVIEGNKLICTVTAGEQNARDQVKKIDLGCKQNITGSIIFEENGDIIKVIDVNLKPKNIDRLSSMLVKNFSFKKA